MRGNLYDNFYYIQYTFRLDRPSNSYIYSNQDNNNNNINNNFNNNINIINTNLISPIHHFSSVPNNVNIVNNSIKNNPNNYSKIKKRSPKKRCSKRKVEK